MMIKNKAIVDDDWVVLRLAENETPESVTVAAGKVIVPLKVWFAQRDKLTDRSELGVWFASDERPEELKNDIGKFAVIAVDFPKFSDGRGYSIAYNLRARLGYTVSYEPSVMYCETSCFICNGSALMLLRHVRIVIFRMH